MTTKNVRKEDIIRILKEETCDNCIYLDIDGRKKTCIDREALGHQPIVEQNTCSRFKKIEKPWILSDEQVENFRRIKIESKKIEQLEAEVEEMKRFLTEHQKNEFQK